MSAEQVKFVPKNGHRVRIAGHWDHSRHLRLNPGHSIQVQNVYVIEALVAIVTTKHVQLTTDSAHSMAGSSGRLLTAHLRLGPYKTHRIKQMEVIEPLIAIMPAMEIYFLPIDRRCVIISTSWLLAKSFRLASAD